MRSANLDTRGHALYEAAHIILTRPIKGGGLKSRAMKLAKRAGMKKAKVALARKLAVVRPHTSCSVTPGRRSSRWIAAQFGRGRDSLAAIVDSG
jgi:hypothetical protein